MVKVKQGNSGFTESRFGLIAGVIAGLFLPKTNTKHHNRKKEVAFLAENVLNACSGFGVLRRCGNVSK